MRKLHRRLGVPGPRAKLREAPVESREQAVLDALATNDPTQAKSPQAIILAVQAATNYRLPVCYVPHCAT